MDKVCGGIATVDIYVYCQSIMVLNTFTHTTMGQLSSCIELYHPPDFCHLITLPCRFNGNAAETGLLGILQLYVGSVDARLESLRAAFHALTQGLRVICYPLLWRSAYLLAPPEDNSFWGLLAWCIQHVAAADEGFLTRDDINSNQLTGERMVVRWLLCLISCKSSYLDFLLQLRVNSLQIGWRCCRDALWMMARWQLTWLGFQRISG